MNPHRLDLVTWQWFRESGLVPKPGPGDALALPTPRQRAAAEKIGKTWLLMHGGSPTQVCYANFANDPSAVVDAAQLLGIALTESRMTDMLSRASLSH